MTPFAEKSMSASRYIADVKQQDFDSLVLQKSREVPVLVDFWAAWCGPCRMLAPILAKLADEYQGKFFLAKIDTDSEKALAAKYGIRSLPTVKLFKNHEVVNEFIGVQPEKTMRALIDRCIARESDVALYNAVLHWTDQYLLFLLPAINTIGTSITKIDFYCESLIISGQAYFAAPGR